MRIASFAALFFFVVTTGATAQIAPDAVARGKAIAQASDCVSCHGANFAGGQPVESPVGDIYASNITPDLQTGIGGWTEVQFRDSLREGRSPTKGRLYPAMPYTSYTGMTDGDIADLYAYLKSRPPVRNKVRPTNLGFPFLRPAMIAWDALYVSRGNAVGAKPATGAAARRGRYLAESLGHCTTCHTPRGQLMGEESRRHLGGAYVGGWYAPNITSGKDGIGDWSDQDIARLLTQGHNSVAVAGGEMSLVVNRSLSQLPAGDIADIVAYLRQVPAVASSGTAPIPTTSNTVDPDTVEGGGVSTSDNTTNGARLFQGACASCHGLSGGGGAGPGLEREIDLRRVQPDNLVQIIAKGVRGSYGSQTHFMPGLRDQMSNAQIAAVASYVIATFAEVKDRGVDAAQVAAILSNKKDVGWLMRNAAFLAWSSIVLATLVVVALIVLFVRRRRHV